MPTVIWHLPTAIWHLLLRSSRAHCDLARAVQVARSKQSRRKRRALIKSNSPHLAGGNQQKTTASLRRPFDVFTKGNLGPNESKGSGGGGQ